MCGSQTALFKHYYEASGPYDDTYLSHYPQEILQLEGELSVKMWLHVVMVLNISKRSNQILCNAMGNTRRCHGQALHCHKSTKCIWHFRFGGTLNSGTSLNSETSLNSRTLRTLMRWYWRNLVTSGENRFCHSLNNNKVRYRNIYFRVKFYKEYWNCQIFGKKKPMKNNFRAFLPKNQIFWQKNVKNFQKTWN